MPPPWFKSRGYKHFDVPVSAAFAEQFEQSKGIDSHAWSPLIQYVKRVKRYKPLKAQTVYKERPIMYASHRDACILSKYAASLTNKLDSFYEVNGLSTNVIGYRRLGKSNYHFSADAYRFAMEKAQCVVLCFDITGFFDHLDHRLLKDRLERLLNVKELPQDWYQVFRHVTKYSYVSRDALAAHPIFAAKFKSNVSGEMDPDFRTGG
jgi:RNA-directed DNA polymerase